MVSAGLLVRLEARPGKEAELESFLKSGLQLVEREPGTTTWFALKLGPGSFGVFEAFPDELGRKAHLQGLVAETLRARASELLTKPPDFERADVLAAKLKG